VTAPDPEALRARRRTTSRTAALDGAGQPALDALATARVLVVGAGGLGAPVLTYLAGSGLGRITIVDHDVVDTSNLARQTLFSSADVGRAKAACAADRVRGVDPVVEVVALAERFRPEHVADHDVVVDAADSVEVTRAVSDACAAAGVPFVWGTALGYDGQVSVFHDAAAEPVDFHDLHPEALPDEGSCAADGVLPALCGAVGAVMAAQVTAGGGGPRARCVAARPRSARPPRRSPNPSGSHRRHSPGGSGRTRGTSSSSTSGPTRSVPPAPSPGPAPRTRSTPRTAPPSSSSSARPASAPPPGPVPPRRTARPTPRRSSCSTAASRRGAPKGCPSPSDAGAATMTA